MQIPGNADAAGGKYPVMDRSDEQLWRGWLEQRDEHAFETLVRPHIPFALDFARRLGCRADEADDVVQTCLTRLMGEENLRPVRIGLRAWIGRSVSLETRMLRRSEGRRARREQAWTPWPGAPARPDERMGAVELAIEALTPAQREVVLLRFRHDLDYAEIARMLDVSENACRLRVHKAMRDLRYRLGQDAGPLVATLPLLAGRDEVGLLAAALAAGKAGAPTAMIGGALAGWVAVLVLAVVAFLLATGREEPDALQPLPVDEAEAPERTERDAGTPGAPSEPRLPGNPPPRSGAGLTPGGSRSADSGAGLPAVPAAPERPPPPPLPPPAPFFAQVQERPRDVKDLVEAAREYFDPEVEPWRGRKAFLDELSQEAQAGRHWLRDMQALRWLVAQGRYIHVPMTDRKWRSREQLSYNRLGGDRHLLRGEGLSIAFQLPRAYPKAKVLSRKYPRIEPYPLLVTMHEKRDYTGQAHPGALLLERRYPRGRWRDLLENWLVLCPLAAAGNYLDAKGALRADVFQQPLSRFWKHHHVDFERVILDGSKQAFAVAASQPLYFAGIVFRAGEEGAWSLETNTMRREVQNFAHVPVYVVDNPDLARHLREAGHGAVTEGTGAEPLVKWLEERQRSTPRKFTWTLERPDQALAHWVNLESVDWDAAERHLQLDIVDTRKEPNTVHLQTRGIRTLSLFLDDDTLRLDDPVRVTTNGRVSFEGRLTPSEDPMRALGRDLDLLFDTEPTRIRLSMYFGWLKAGRVVDLAVEPPK